METAYLRGHLLKRLKDKWVYADNEKDIPANGGEIRPCKKCGALFSLEGHDPCLGLLPGIDNACCGHGIRSEAYIRFKNGKVLTGFIIQK